MSNPQLAKWAKETFGLLCNADETDKWSNVLMIRRARRPNCFIEDKDSEDVNQAMVQQSLAEKVLVKGLQGSLDKIAGSDPLYENEEIAEVESAVSFKRTYSASEKFECVCTLLDILEDEDIDRDFVTPSISPIPTFYNGRQRTLIDFIFRYPALTTTSPEIIFLNPAWTDHSLLTVLLTLQHPSGSGVIKNFTITYAKQFARQCKTVERSLCSERHPIFRNPSLPDLAKTEARLARLQEFKTANLAQRASVQWTESDEQSNAYFYRVIRSRTIARSITSLRDPESGENLLTLVRSPLLVRFCLSHPPRHCLVLAQRHLCVRDKSLYANPLLLNTIWHVLYVMPGPPSFFTAICKSIRIYPSLGFGSPLWDLLCQPQRKGGLGLLDPESQQKVLQLRCTLPILRDSHARSQYIFPYLTFFFQLHFPSPSLKDFLPSTIPLSARFSPATALALPLHAIWTFLPPFSITRWNKGIYVQHAFMIDSRGGLCRIPPHDIRHARNRIIAFFRHLDGAKIVLWPWFISLLSPSSPDSPRPVDGLFSLVSLIQIDGRPLHKALTGSLRRHLLTSTSSIPHADISWKLFWRWSMTQNTRSLCPKCALCLSAVDSLQHFVFSCSRKFSVWTLVLRQMCQLWSISDVPWLLTRTRLSPFVSSSLQIANASIVVHTIWHAHWTFVFDNSLFLPSVVAAKAVTAIHRSHDLNST
ncbi:hypothetical protein J3Q64DRAFT_1849099 [Phycomyces blakesleeanus]|uniref:Reverse transcriptase zinc-binding domain-containing protein n=2 Tax=Phycomyces blakesleeanus TaxID=4837 RepID=A0A167MM01_PHYB8|nr:hypothetical protein PHYBLDRAFT_145638 [Phycomyces blakesleeanus NRRL 1555(-)]OAD73236.1 hypothetical protein PHYBLDRAFT_145638 [Phycomyces blakesleeanus NRRL 1555(-)]|eukprot:XP_018291276.1 hypothetical protein PHYBLDRAFT_145638 [Phycomyces blakesleeanus NRRL 1555(-)]